MTTNAEMVIELAEMKSSPAKAPAPDSIQISANVRPRRRPAQPVSWNGAVIGTLAAVSESGEPLVNFEGSPNPLPLPAKAAAAFSAKDIGRGAVLLFESGDPLKPILMAFLQSGKPGTAAPAIGVSVDGEQVTLSAKSEVILRCGKASITLTRAGKVIIRGAYLLSRSSGVNRIKGASVQIN